MSFDLSVYDIFGTLGLGATLVLIHDQRDVDNLIYVIEEYKITIWNSVPAIMDMAVENMDSSFRNSSLRLVLLSGDWIPLRLPNRIKYHFENAEVISLGGATEASIWSISIQLMKLKKEWSSIPYGMPLANQKFYVLNYEQEICPMV